MPGPGTFELASETVGPLPIVNHFLARMGLGEVLEHHLPHDDARLRLAPAAVIGVVVRNLIVSHQPVYASPSGPPPTRRVCSVSTRQKPPR